MQAKVIKIYRCLLCQVEAQEDTSADSMAEAVARSSSGAKRMHSCSESQRGLMLFAGVRLLEVSDPN